MKKGNDTRTYSAAELQGMRARGETRTDPARAAAVSEEELERQIAADPDFRDIPPDWFETAEAMMPAPKKLLSLRLDEDVLDWFRQQGPGYQTRMNAVLKAYVRSAQRKAAPRKRA